MSAAAGLRNSWIPVSSRYCHGNTDSQFATRMNTNSVTASGRTNGAIFIPIALSIWLRVCTVMASQNNCTPLGTPEAVTLERR